MPKIFSLLCPEVKIEPNWAQVSKKTVSFDDTLHIIDDASFMNDVDFDCGITFYPGVPTEFRLMNGERNFNFSSCENHKCIPSTDQLNCFLDAEHTPNVFLSPYGFMRKWIEQLT